MSNFNNNQRKASSSKISIFGYIQLKEIISTMEDNVKKMEYLTSLMIAFIGTNFRRAMSQYTCI
jgi:hypothetical protein